MTKQTTEFERIVRNANLNTSYTANDFVNPDSYDSRSAKQRAWVILNAGYVHAIVFGEYLSYCEQDALDEAVDRGKLDFAQVTDEELKDYETGTDSEGNPEYEGILHLGNASEPFALEALDIWILPASAFAEDPALMSFDRVLSRLDDIEDTAERAYQAIGTDDAEWLPRYQATRDIKDAKTLARLTYAR